MTDRRPRIGDSVLYRDDTTGQDRAAIVTRVHHWGPFTSPEHEEQVCGGLCVNLCVFTDQQTTQGASATKHVVDAFFGDSPSRWRWMEEER